MIDAELRAAERAGDGPRAAALRRRAGLPPFVPGDVVAAAIAISWPSGLPVDQLTVVEVEEPDPKGARASVLVREPSGETRWWNPGWLSLVTPARVA